MLMKSSPIDIPGAGPKRRQSMRPMKLSPTHASSSASNVSVSWPPAPKSYRNLVVEIASPIKNMDTMTGIFADAFPTLDVYEVMSVLHQLNKQKVARILCDTSRDASVSCRKLVENGIEAWIE